MENEFDLGLNIASLEAELPDPVITLTGSDTLTASDTAKAPLLNLNVYGRSWQNSIPSTDTPVAIESIGDSGSLTVTTCGKNLYEGSQDWSGEWVNAEKWTTSTETYNGLAIKSSSDAWNGLHKLLYVTAGKTYTFTCYAKSQLGTAIVTIYAVHPSGTGIDHIEGSAMPPKVAAASVTLGTEWVRLSVKYVCTASGYINPRIEKRNAEDTLYVCGYQLEESPEMTDYEPYESTTAEITTNLPLRGVPVSNGGNYIDSKNQEWICDTIEHVYGENAQAVKRITEAVVASAIDMHGGSALLYEYTSPGDEYPRYEWYFESGRITNNGSLICANYVWHKYYNRYGELITDSEQSGGNLSTTYTSDKYKLIGDWKADDGSVSVLAESPYTLDNGDAFPQEYMCETLPPVVGAKIIYPSAEAEIIPFTTKETEAFNSLQSFSESTTVYNNTTADMTVKILREDYEMQYVYWLKESQTFICEKAGKYKIICVGGGSSGGVGAPGASEHLQAAGTTTSFGTVISAAGGTKSRGALVGLSANSGELSVGGQSGYDGINYASTSHIIYQDTGKCATSSGGESTVMWGTGHGYGAGGGAKGVAVKYTAGSTETVNFTASGGQCGRIESTIVDLEEGQAVYCTVGGGGVLNVSDAELLEYIKSVYSTATAVTTTGAQVSACASDGADGVIIVQYLGL